MIQEINPQGTGLNPNLTNSDILLEPPYLIQQSHPTYCNIDILREAIKLLGNEHFYTPEDKANFIIDTYKKFKKTLNEN